MFLAVQAGKSPLPLCATCSPEAATLVQGEWVWLCSRRAVDRNGQWALFDLEAVAY